MNEKIGRVLAIDYGSVRIGLALSDPLQIIASGLTTIANSERSIREIVEIISLYEVTKILIGLPLTLKGEHGGKAEEVREFSEKLQQQVTVPILHYDERFTSVMAQQTIREMGTSKKKRHNNKGKVDEIAATILLQNFLDSATR
ncbi:MAG: Holliday junction resolvase RuvX [Bacteroidetes bacterium]|nr:Holliday junction resolvase RuvX [Bacteroidota bacterium]